jgi:hypothetical protein
MALLAYPSHIECTISTLTYSRLDSCHGKVDYGVNKFPLSECCLFLRIISCYTTKLQRMVIPTHHTRSDAQTQLKAIWSMGGVQDFMNV